MLDRIFSFALLSGASWTTLHKVFTSAMLSQELIQHCAVILHVQCCLEPLEEHCTGFLPVNCWPMDNRQLFLAKFKAVSIRLGQYLHRNIVFSVMSEYV